MCFASDRLNGHSPTFTVAHQNRLVLLYPTNHPPTHTHTHQQRNKTSSEGQQFLSRYHINLDDLPIVAIIDPRTGGKVREWLAATMKPMDLSTIRTSPPTHPPTHLLSLWMDAPFLYMDALPTYPQTHLSTNQPPTHPPFPHHQKKKQWPTSSIKTTSSPSLPLASSNVPLPSALQVNHPSTHPPTHPPAYLESLAAPRIQQRSSSFGSAGKPPIHPPTHPPTRLPRVPRCPSHPATFLFLRLCR